MAKHFTEEKLLHSAQSLFETLATREEIAQELAEYTYDAEKIAEGKALFEAAKAQQQANQKETKEEIQAYEKFNKAFGALVETYRTHRKKAKIVFKDEPATLKILALNGSIATRMLSLLEEIGILYSKLDKDNAFKTAVQKMKISPEDITAQLTKLAEAQQLYAQYTTEKGESQQATKDKNQAFAALEKWVRDFYSVAKIALEDKPQLLESVGKFVRS